MSSRARQRVARVFQGCASRCSRLGSAAFTTRTDVRICCCCCPPSLPPPPLPPPPLLLLLRRQFCWIKRKQSDPHSAKEMPEDLPRRRTRLESDATTPCRLPLPRLRATASSRVRCREQN